MDEIINKVANSQLIVFDLEDYYPKEKKSQIDISLWLTDGFLLKEKEFRNYLKNHNFAQYQNCLVAINCSTDAILPTWASILVTSFVTPFAKKIFLGSIKDIDIIYYQEILQTLNFNQYKNKAVILKGCSKKQVPESAFVLSIQLLQPLAKSIMYGEACSAVPIFKKSN